MKIDKLKCAVLGAGGMGSRNAGYAEETGLAEVTALCSRRPDGGEPLRNLLGRPVTVYNDFEKMISRERPDVLMVALPPFAHRGEVEAAAEAGIHLFLEKPIALTLERAASQVRAVQDSGVLSQVNFHFRFTPLALRLRSLKDAGELGRPLVFSASYFCNSLHSPWWRDVEKSGGQVVEQVIHLYDMARYFAGPFNRITARGGNYLHTSVEGYTVEDNAAALLSGPSGSLAALVSTNCAVAGAWRSRFSLVTENFTAEYDSAGTGTLTRPGGETEDLSSAVDPHYTSVEQFLTVLMEGGTPPVPISEGYESLDLVLRAARQFREAGQSR